MMAIAAPTHIEWTTASPLWSTQDQAQQLWQPALLRFQSDTFMQDLVALLQKQTDAEQLTQEFAALLAKPESFRAPPPGESETWQAPPLDHLKLYQPIHGSYYLVAATLVCHTPGFPDRAVDTTHNEKVSFVLRRLGSSGEMAWVNDPTQTKTPGKIWQPLADANKIAANEELFPLFPLYFTVRCQKRRLLIGLVPTSSHESYRAAPLSSEPSLVNPFLTTEDNRLDEVASSVLDAIRQLHSYQESTPPSPERLAQEIEASQFILLDFAVFLQKQMPTLWLALTNPNPSAPVPPDLTSGLYTLLKTPMLTTEPTTWQQALLLAWASRPAIIEGIPALPFNLKQVNISTLGTPKDPVSKLQTLLQTALQQFPRPLPQPTEVPTLPKMDAGIDTRYVLRCVYQRPNCPYLCPDIVSEATQPFALAPFFDFDAPGRPLRITMPTDTSIAGLRKFRKNVAFLISNKLRQQMESVGNLKDVLNGQVNGSAAAQFDFGTICSFSIPIITICALIVLLIFLYLLNIVFWWIPFFRICFPLRMKWTL